VLTPIQLKKLVVSLQKGGLIALPTETVYALAGDARNLVSIQKIFQLKNRPLNQPLSVLLPQNYNFNAWTDNVSSIAQRLADHFWPGPLTLIFDKNRSVLSELVGGGNKIGLRVPDHVIAQAILRAFASGLAAPSANLSTHLSPSQADHVRQAFGDKIDTIIDGGPCSIGIESTIVDVTTPVPRILRLGTILKKDLQHVVDSEFINDFSVSIPHRKLFLQQVEKAKLKSITHEYLNQGKSVVVLARHAPNLIHKNLIWINMPKEANYYAHVLYKYLHQAEQNSTHEIVVESLPMNERWSGIRTLIGNL
jgi:L-threonylcarbamoyladenylate synthase